MITLLAAIVGIVAGWNCFYILLVVLLKARKGAPFGWRESLLFGFLLLVLAGVLGWSAQTFTGFYRVGDIFGAAILAGAGLCQLWFCWKATVPRRFH